MNIFPLRRISFLIVLFQSVIILSQDKSEPKDWFVEAESYFLFEEYKDALPLYQRILKEDPDNYNVIYKLGVCYLNDLYQKEKSIQYLEKASKNITTAFKQNNYKERQAPTEVLYYLGKAYHTNNKLDEAIDAYQRFKKQANPDDFDLGLVDDDIISCQVAKKMLGHPIYLSLKNAGTIINSRFEEVNPIISGDGKTLVFTRKLQFYDAVFVTLKQGNGEWSPPINLTPDFGLDGNSYPCGISNTGDEIYVYRSDEYDGNIYSSKLMKQGWSKLVKLNANINTKFWESHASPSLDGKYIYFTSNRPGGYGGLDIYKSKKGINGEWGEPVNLGPVINSPENEDTPFLSNDGYTLFFSSQGHENIGGYDVFASNLQSNGFWSKPKNMGYPLNTTSDDIFYNPINVSWFGIYSLYDPVSTAGLRDIYFTEVYNDLIPRNFTLKGKINKSGTNLTDYNQMMVKLVNTKTSQIVVQTEINDDGSYNIKAPQGDYSLVVEGGAIKTVSQSVNLSLTQAESTVIVGAISVENAGKIGGFGTAAVATSVIENTIKVKNTYFTVTDSSNVAIELELSKDVQLTVDAMVNDKSILHDELIPGKRKFIYNYSPLTGENILIFKSKDKDGGISSTTVIVNYVKPAKEIISEKNDEKLIDHSISTYALSLIATGELSKYLKSIDASKYTNYFDLYSDLMEQSKIGKFSADDVNNMYSVFFSQKDVSIFNEQFSRTGNLEAEATITLRDSAVIPLDLIDRILTVNLVSKPKCDSILLEVLTKEKDNIGIGLPAVFALYGNPKPSAIYDSGDSNLDTYEKLIVEIGEVNAEKTLYIGATSENLDYLYQNLLISSNGTLNNYLSELNFQSKNIYTSVDLVNHLFQNTETAGYSTQELIEALTLANENRQIYFEKFKTMLTNAAEGNLKSELASMNLKRNNLNQYEDLVSYLLNQSSKSNYTKEGVYDLMLKLIGINDVNKFAEKLKSYNIEGISRALGDTSLTAFSNTLELIQYLLSVGNDYNFKQSDINNLLIRMLLERGLSDINLQNVPEEKSWFKTSKFITTIVLVNVLVLILIILIVGKRRRNNK